MKISPLSKLAAAMTASVFLQACDQAPSSQSSAGTQTDPKVSDKAAATAAAKTSASPATVGSSKTHALPQNVYFGDTHLHTSYSMDAGAFGNRLDPDAAYRFAKGEEVTASSGIPAKLQRPLDFLVVADHSDNMGFFPDLLAGKEHLLSDAKGKDWYDRVNAGKGGEVAIEIIKLFSQGELKAPLLYSTQSEAYHTAWDNTVNAAEDHNQPGKFTAFIGYEWTSLIRGGNMHRVVIYRDDAIKSKQMVPFTATPPEGSINPRDLWKWMDRYETTTGGRVLAIAHNGNLANGIMFPVDAQFDGTTLDKEYVSTRIQREPLYEVTQIKGDGETHPYLSADDEFADYETWAFGNLDLSTLKTDDMLAAEYAREALKNGLKLEQTLGTNPYKFGLIGSTDSHTSLATANESNYFGKASNMEPNPHRLDATFIAGSGESIYDRDTVASGLAAVWASENTREAIFDAMERKETYATTGSRMKVRTFGGWNFTEADLTRNDFAEYAYARGVPMGGDLKAEKPAANAAPQFLIQTVKDPDGANLDRVQVIKGWLDQDGKTHEVIYDIACAGERKIVPHSSGGQRCDSPVGSTVDVTQASYTNTIGAANLNGFWQDPKFDPKQSAFYYTRVLEIPTPRWTTYDAVRFDKPLPKDVPAEQQDRAYTSPIWYTPK